MTLVGSCYVCSKPGMYSCAYCGRVVCIDHYIKPRRSCVNCLGKLGDSSAGDDDTSQQEILF
jgi:hypothetical protein